MCEIESLYLKLECPFCLNPIEIECSVYHSDGECPFCKTSLRGVYSDLVANAVAILTVARLNHAPRVDA